MIGYVGFYFSLDRMKLGEAVLGRNNSFQDMLRQAITCLGQHNFTMTELNIENKENIYDLVAAYGALLIWIDEYYLPDSYYYKKYHFNGLVCVEEVSSQNITIYDRLSQKISLSEWYEIIELQRKCKVVYCNKDFIGSDCKDIKYGIKIICQQMMIKDPNKEKGLYGLREFIKFIKECNNMGAIEAISYQLKRPSSPMYSRKDLAYILQKKKCCLLKRQ